MNNIQNPLIPSRWEMLGAWALIALLFSSWSSFCIFLGYVIAIGG